MGSEQAKNAIAIGESMGMGLTAANQDKVSAILSENYDSVLFPAVSSFWKDTDVSTLESIRFTDTGTTQERVTGSVSSFLDPVWNGSAVEFVPKEAYKDNAEVIKLANDINIGPSSIGVPLNNLINAHANLTNTDPKVIWEQQFAGRVFGLGPDGKPVEAPIADRVNAALDSISGTSKSLEDFQPESVDALAEFIIKETEQAMLPDITPSSSGTEDTVVGFEGFSSTPYWDVNAYRVGFGSDTITKPDGTVVNVTPGMTVTREDAARDLTRRLNTEFIPGIVKDVGDEAWARLPEQAKTALASIAYNYGSIGRGGANIVAAVRSGDLEAIAQAIERLKSHNDGINAKRRQAEANMVRGSM